MRIGDRRWAGGGLRGGGDLPRRRKGRPEHRRITCLLASLPFLRPADALPTPCAISSPHRASEWRRRVAPTAPVFRSGALRLSDRRVCAPGAARPCSSLGSPP